MDRKYDSTVRMGLFIVFTMMGILRLTSGNNSNCKDLEVFDGTKNVAAGVNCTLYKTPVCSIGDTSTFPGNLSSGESVSQPREFKVSLYRQNISHYEASGIEYTWTVPLDGISRKYGKGYYIHMERVGSEAATVCRVFALKTNDSLADSTMVNFKYTIFPLTREETYKVELLSLPPPSVAEYEQGLLHRHVVLIPKATDFSAGPVYPNSWMTWISLVLFSREGKIEVTFGLPAASSKARFTNFTGQLIRNNETIPTKEFFFVKKDGTTKGVFNFTGVTDGLYRVHLYPVDLFYKQPGRCQCYFHTSFDMMDCGECQTTATEMFEFTRSVFTTTPSPSPSPSPTAQTSAGDTTTEEYPPVKTGSSTGNSDRSNLNGGEIAAVSVLVPVIIIGLVLLAAVCFWKQRNSGMQDNAFDQKKNGTAWPNAAQPDTKYQPFSTEKGLPVAPTLTRKSVVVLASEDHKHFNQAVLSFVRFLGLHCQCDVTFAPDRLLEIRKTANSYCWLSGKIDKTDYVIIVTSEASCNLYDAYRDGLVYKEGDFGPEGDLFTPAMRHICGKINRGEDVSNLMMVHFEHTKKMLPIAALPPSYNLPYRLKSLLLHIHDLDENKMNLSKVNLPLNGNVEGLEGGKEWLRAVHESKEFERNTPGWFETKFGTPADTRDNGNKHSLKSQVSDSSNESGFVDGGPPSGNFERRLSSVSSHEKDPALVGFVNEGYCNSKSEFYPPSEAGGKSDFYPPSEAGKSDFYSPSEVGKNCFYAPSMAPSAYTCPYSTYTEAEKPEEIDGGCSISDQMREFNQRNEMDWSQDQQQQQQQQQGPECIPQDSRSAISDQTNSSHAVQFQYPDQDMSQALQFQYPGDQDSHHLDHIDIVQHDLDCVSLSSAQSV